jgi:hypothetical protein
MSETQYRFPENLLNGTNAYPYIKFSILDPKKDGENAPSNTINICLFMPTGIQFQDGASYNTMNLGAIGSQVLGGDGTATGFAKGTAEAISASIDKAMEYAQGNVLGGLAAAIAAKVVPGASFSSASEVFQFANKKVLNPYSNVAFTGSTLRSFSFSFKLIASSEVESRTIRNIIYQFRKHMYPKEYDKFILNYPNKFEITFWSGDSQDESDYIPKIYQCYLTALNDTYNSTANTYFKDGAPTEVDVSLTFQETRALSRNDIEDLNERKIRSYADRANAPLTYAP